MLLIYALKEVTWKELPILVLCGAGLCLILLALLWCIKKSWAVAIAKHFEKSYFELTGLTGIAYLLSGVYWWTPRRYYMFVEEQANFSWYELLPFGLAALVFISTQLFWFPKNRKRLWLTGSTATALCLPIAYGVFPGVLDLSIRTSISFANNPHLLYGYNIPIPFFFLALLTGYTILRNQLLRLAKKTPLKGA